jgi:hypothetical protein
MNYKSLPLSETYPAGKSALLVFGSCFIDGHWPTSGLTSHLLTGVLCLRPTGGD